MSEKQRVPETRTEAEALIRASPLAAQADELIAALEPAICVVPERCDLDTLPLGASRFAGEPDVPPGFEWPVGWAGPLAFLAQIDLAETAPFDEARLLPDRGWLYFFSDVNSGPEWGALDAPFPFRVLHADAARDTLERVPEPKGVDEEALDHEPCRLSFRRVYTLPDDPPIDTAEPLRDAYGTLRRDLDRGHRLLGHVTGIGQDPRLDCERRARWAKAGEDAKPEEADEGDESVSTTALEDPGPGVADWRLLFLIDSDEEGPDWMWGDVGWLCVMIRKQDLAARRFEAAIMAPQSH